MKIVVGMSGGVDSAVAALLIKKLGHEVIGAIMKIWRGRFSGTVKRNACYGPDEAHDIETARAICAQIGIPLRIVDCAEKYEDIVLKYFRDEYLSGKTPNPCVRCNQLVKFGVLPEVLKSSGISFDFFATGHYANADRDTESGRYLLKKAKDSQKDQTYFLYRLSQEQLSQIQFPLGNYLKEEVRAIAREAGLAVHDKKESQDFYSGDLEDLLQKENIPGDIVMTNGKVLGEHRGIWHYTVGQRKGLGVSYSEPLYVVEIDAVRNRIVLGTEKETCRESCLVNLCNWIAVENLPGPMDVQVKIRSTGKAAPACIEPATDGAVTVTFSVPASAITPGQSAVFYDGEKVVGGGIIE